ncbi:MAG: AMP-binding protein [Acidobacteriota bacterium]
MRENLLTFLSGYEAMGEKTAFAYRPDLRMVRWSGQRIATTAYQFARELEARSIGKGDHVLFWAENRPELVAAFFGCLLRGVVVVPLDKLSAPDFVARVAQQTQPKLMLYSGNRGNIFDVNIPAIKVNALAAMVALHHPSPYPTRVVNADEIVEIIYTSGTTGEPKGVCLTHRNLLASLMPLEQWADEHRRWVRWVQPLRFLNLLPLSHIFGQLMGLFVPQILQAEVHFLESLNPSEIIETIKHEKISALITIPRLLETLRGKIEREWETQGKTDKYRKLLSTAETRHFLRRWWAFRKVRALFGWRFWAIVSGGATLDKQTERFWRGLGYLLVQGYGMTETASLISYNDPFQTTLGSIGTKLPGVEIKLDDSGEILVRGNNISPGYWRQGVSSLTDNEGWFRTGDLGEVDASGNLYFKGRKKDVIATAAGLKIYPEDLEAALNTQPGVRDSVVIGIEGPLGPEPLAVLLMRDSGSEPEAVIKRANEQLSDYQQIRRWQVWQGMDFPRTALHKVRKREVLENLQALAPALPTVQLTPLVETVARVSGEVPARLDASANLTTDLKLDSLGRVELLSALEDRYQVELDEASFTAATTLGDVEKLVSERTAESSRPYPYPEWPRYLIIRWLRIGFLYAVILPLTRLFAWLRVRGKAQVREEQVPVLFIANHITMIDPVLVISALPGRFKRHLAIAMIGEMLRNWRYPPEGTHWLKRLFLRLPYALVLCFFNAFSLPQESGFRRSFTVAGRLMDAGYNLLVFPEGQRTQDGRLNPFMKGIGLLASKLNAQIIPIKISGLFELKKRNRYFALPGEITLTIGEPVRYEAGKSPDEITEDLQQRLAKL